MKNRGTVAKSGPSPLCSEKHALLVGFGLVWFVGFSMEIKQKKKKNNLQPLKRDCFYMN